MRELKKASKKIISFLLAMCMIIGLMPMNSYAASETETSSLDAALAEAKTYIDALTINNSDNDPETVVSNFGTHFTWDNEKRESSKTYLFDWSYYNGVVFEGLEYVYEVTGEKVYADYVKEYMSSLIASNGTWAKCTNNSSKECAGYNSTHGADCYKTASLLLDLYERTNDSRYLTMAKTLYADLDTAEKSYLLSDAGNNYRHTWADDPSLDLWLDGLYMILPFRAEYAKHIGDTEELDLIVSRMKWVSDNMYNSSKGLFYHAANSASSNSGTYWLRSIGWYAAAIVDVMDSMEGENLEAMKKQLVKLVDGMKACQNASNGMWLNNLNASQSFSNPYETSGTALVCYAVMKAVNEGWLAESYADMAILAFEGICNEKLSDTTLTDICFKGAPGSSNSTFYDNEGKGVGPFIMFYAEVLEYVNAEEETPEEPEVTVEDTTIKVENVTNLSGTAVTEADKAIIKEKEYTNFVAYDITATLVEGAKAIVSIPVPTEWNATEDQLMGISVEEGVVKEIKGTLSKDGIYSFEVDHFSAKGVAYSAEPVAEEPGTAESVSGTGNLVGSKVYTLDTDGVTANKNYLIVNTNSGTGYALTNNNGSSGRTPVTISGNTITVGDDASIAWQFSKNISGTNATTSTIENDDKYIYINDDSISLTDDKSNSNMTVKRNTNGTYRIYRDRSKSGYYLRYASNKWTGSTTQSNVYLYELTSSSAGEAVTFTVTPGSTTIAPKGTAVLTGTVTVAGETVDLGKCTISWASSDTSKATVSDGIVTGVADGTANITATLSAVNETSLQKDIVLTIPVTVASKQVVSMKLTGNTPVTTKLNVVPDFSNIKLVVTYEDGDTADITVDNGLVIEGYDITKIGYTYAEIYYAGVKYGEVKVTVEGNPYEGLVEATDYPEYPADGAVRIDKTATHSADQFKNTGVTHVELDVAGISVKTGVNVIMISDISNSMSWDDSEYDYADTAVTTGTNQRLNISKTAAKTFVNEFLADNTGEATDNTFTLLAFAGIDGDYNEHTTANNNDDVYQLGSLAMTSIDEAEAAIDGLVKATTGGTNYDYAFQQAYSLAQKLNKQNGKEVYIVFMTDGVPTHYNGVYYKSRSNTDLTAKMLYIDPTSGEKSLYTSTGYDRAGNDIDATAKQNIVVYYNDGTTATKNVTYNKGWSDYVINNPNGWAEKVKALDYVSEVFCIGFGMKNGSVTQGATTSMPTLSGVNGGAYYIPSTTTQTLLKHIATNENDYYEADNEEELDALYERLANQIKFAGTSAQVTDIVDSDFTLQMANYSGSGDKTAPLTNPPSITVTAYDLYAKTDNKVDENGNDLTGSRTGKYDAMEVVTFNDEGTAAYSDQIGDGNTNIMTTGSDGTVVIEAFYFTYTKTKDGVETFKWKIGNITDKEVVLGFDAYLKGALEGEADPGTYYTNEEAILEYIDINGKYAKKIFDVPHVNWGGASTTIRFYLVNEKGEPVNHAGEVVPWANRIYVGDPVNVKINLNADLTIEAQTIEAAAYVPGEYFLYDHEAYYTVGTASGEIVTGGITVSEPSDDARKTTYDENGNAVVQTGAQTTRVIDAEVPYYTWSFVGFGVRYDLSKEEITPLNEDIIVMDYGKDIQVDVLANDTEVIPEGWTAELVGFVKYNANTDVKYIQANSGSATYEGQSEYGKFSIVDSKVVNYKPTKMLSVVQKVFCAIKFVETENPENVHYRYNVLNIVPATSVYYETNNDQGECLFEINVSANSTSEWQKATVTGDVVADGPQEPGTIGQNLYGYDKTYDNDKYLSNGSSLKAIGQGVKVTTAQFTFTGTGFDLISRTGAEQGSIRVDIYSDSARTNRVKSITVLNKSESNLELYQIPVVSAEVDYGTYYVTVGVNAAYTNTNYPDLSRGGEFYFDAIRVYNPISEADKDYNIVMSAYMADGEANMELKEVRAMLLADEGEILGTTEEDENGNEVDVEGIVFVDRKYETGEDGTITETGTGLTEYTTIGPNNEVYLTGTQAIGFGIKVDPTNLPTSIDIGAKSVHGETAFFNACLFVGDEEVGVAEKEIKSSTAQNIDLLAGESISNILGDETELYVIIENYGDGILSITDLKIAYGNGTSSASIFANKDVLDKTIEIVEGPSEEISYDVLSANFTKDSIKRNGKAKLIVTTSIAVETIEIKNKAGRKQSFDVLSVETVDGVKTWTVQYKITSAGTQKYTICGYGADGNTGATATATIKVKR